jgi:twinkle protein
VEESAIRAHLPCDDCGSSDALSEYSDHTYCHSCSKWRPLDGETKERGDTPASPAFLQGNYQGIPKRNIKEDSCRKYGYQIGDHCQIANYRDDQGRVVAQKIRRKDKQFAITGDPKKMGLYGQHLFAGGGKTIAITEGEVDCLSLAQVLGLRWPVVSLPNGAQSAVKAVQKALEWLDTFDKIIICFDQDEPGQKAAQAVAEILPVGKAHIVSLPRKDANEVLVEDGDRALVTAYYEAKPWRPDGIVAGSEFTLERLKAAMVQGYPVPYPLLNAKSGGLREGELTLLTAGSGIGKSTLARELAYCLHQQSGLTIGNIFLEENNTKTAQAYVAIDNNVRLSALRQNPNMLTDDQWRKSLANVLHTRMYFYDHFGSLDSERLLAKIRYMRTVLGCHFVVLDHISIVISGQESSSEGERKDIDRLMTKLRSLIEETGVGILGIVHLNSPEGRPHEEGGRVTLKNLRGSGSLKQLSDNVWAMERDQQNDQQKNMSQIRVLKDREDGAVGVADVLEFTEQGRLVPINMDSGLEWTNDKR